MRLPNTLCLVVLAGCALCLRASLADDAKPPQAADDAKLLKGNWNVVALESEGRKAPAAALKGMRWSFAGSEVQFADPGEEAGGKSSVKLDTSKSPKHIDLVGLEGPQKGKTVQGIYKLEKDRLVICLRDAEAAKKGRPEEFSTEAGSGLGLITLERVKE
jgi:uncharacterized protein (TIGR03067 family)